MRQNLNASPNDLRCLWLTEEPKGIWRDRVKLWPELAINNFVLVFASNMPWKQILKGLEGEETDIVLIDTIRAFCGIQDENDAPAWHEAVWPLILWAREKNWTLILLHHLRKSPAETGLGHAGSHAIVGMVDNALEIHRDIHKRTRRICKARSRFDETPEEFMIELRDGELVTLGDPGLVEAAALQKRVIEVLDATPRTRAELADLLDPKPSEGALKAALRALFDGKQVQREGRGVRKDPHKWFRLFDLASIERCRARIEMRTIIFYSDTNLYLYVPESNPLVMHDLVAILRCPKCLWPLVEYVWHERGVKDPPTVRWECVLCGVLGETVTPL